MQILSK